MRVRFSKRPKTSNFPDFLEELRSEQILRIFFFICGADNSFFFLSQIPQKFRNDQNVHPLRKALQIPLTNILKCEGCGHTTDKPENQFFLLLQFPNNSYTLSDRKLKRGQNKIKKVAFEELVKSWATVESVEYTCEQ